MKTARPVSRARDRFIFSHWSREGRFGARNRGHGTGHACRRGSYDGAACIDAGARKIDNFGRLSAAETATTEAAAPYTIVDFDAVNDLFESLRCYWCRGAVKLGDRKYGLAVKLGVVRQLRRHRSHMSSHRTDGSQKCNPEKQSQKTTRTLCIRIMHLEYSEWHWQASRKVCVSKHFVNRFFSFSHYCYFGAFAVLEE